MNTQQHKEIRSWKTNRRDALQQSMKNEVKNNHNHTTKGATTMKNTTMFSRFGAAMLIALLISSVQYSFATGTTAGTQISNTASVTFTDGTNVRNKTSNTVQFYVGHKIAGSFSAMADQTALESQTVNIPVTFQSTSNYSTDFSVSYSVVTNGPTETFTPTAYVLHVDGGNDGIYTDNTNDPPVAGNLTFTEGSPTTRYFILRVTTPASANNNDSARVLVTFTEASSDIPASNVYVINNGFTAYREVKIKIQKPVVSVNITQTTPSPATPGSPVPYAITYSNTGATNPTGNVTFTFVVPSNMTWTGGNGPTTLTTTKTLVSAPAPSSDVSYSYSAGTVTFTIPNANLNYANFTGANATNTHTFSLGNLVKIDTTAGGPAPSTTLTTSGTGAWPQFSFSDGSNTINVTPNSTSNVSNITVATAYGFKFTAVSPVSPSLTAAPLEIVEYKFVVRNMGNTTNTVNLTKSHNGTSTMDDSSGTTVRFASAPLAANGSITDNEITSIATIAKGTEQVVYVRVLVPFYKTGTTAAAAADTYIKNIIASAATTTGSLYYDHVSAHSTVVVTTTVTMNTLYVSMAIDSVNIGGVQAAYSGQNPGPGDIVTYKITVSNTSSNTVTNISISNMIPGNLTFLPLAYGTTGITIADGATPTTTADISNAANDDAAQVVGSTFSTYPAGFSLANGVTKIFRYRCVVN